ncbi:hypothetical protein CKO25_14240 [Thiocapsa imhoffii]|uniref:CNP1-like uncharacterized domain-containing protein n=1 Tax=Thiocapsa imhoffii TaxID=382777 RepID=A0A9X0WJQ8_9GAMM|nr:CNP1-like family protein [Thiocapsa imhoffii]MBK1645791.1 hypothetical protein [Thiocapsa imhoffii]
MIDRISSWPWLLLLALALPAAQAENLFVPDASPPVPSSVTEGTPWQEGSSTLPPWPQDEDLIEFVPDGPRSDLRYFIDERSLQVGTDQAVRFTLVAQGPSGARNLSFEGIRCTPQGSYRTYAYGVDGRFEPVASGDWQRIGHRAPERWRHDLWRFHFCVPQGFTPRPRQDMLRSLQGRINPRQNMGFQAD